MTDRFEQAALEIEALLFSVSMPTTGMIQEAAAILRKYAAAPSSPATCAECEERQAKYILNTIEIEGQFKDFRAVVSDALAMLKLRGRAAAESVEAWNAWAVRAGLILKGEEDPVTNERDDLRAKLAAQPSRREVAERVAMACRHKCEDCMIDAQTVESALAEAGWGRE